MKRIISTNNETVLKKDHKKRLLRSYLISTVACATVAVFMVPVLATEGTSDAETAIHNMSNIIFGIIRSLGIILSGWHEFSEP